HHTCELALLQPRAHARHSNHQPAPAGPEAQQRRQPLAHVPSVGGGGGAASGAAGGSDSPPSSVISSRKAIMPAASSGVIPSSLSTSSRSRSRISWRVFLPLRDSTSMSSAGRPLYSASGTFAACSSSGGSGANSGPSPTRSSHSRLE